MHNDEHAPATRPPRHLATAGHGNPAVGLGLMASAMLVLPGMDAIAKLLSAHLHAIEIVWGRYVFQVALMLPIVLAVLGPRRLMPARPGLQVLRGLLLVASAVCFFSSLRYLPLADALAIFFVNPFIVTALSPVLLGEPVGIWRWSAVVAGFAGALLIIRPGADILGGGAPLAFAGASLYALSLIVTRRVAAHDGALLTTLVTGLVGVAATSMALPALWVMPEPAEWGMLAAAGAIAGFGQASVALAFRHAPAAVLAPIGYLEIASGTMLGFWLWGDLPTPLTWAGIAVIVASGLVIVWRETRKGRRAA